VELRAKLGPGSDKNLSTLTDEEFAGVEEKLAAGKVQVSCYASKLGDWSRKITGDFQIDVDDLKNALPRMQKLKIPFIRCMSYVNDNLSEAEWKKESCRRMRELAQMAADGGVTLVHENCTGWGGLSWQNNLELLDAVDSPAFKVVFDTGNPPAHGLDSWEYYLKVKEHIVYVHVKDSLRIAPEGKTVFTFPGEGDGCVRSVVTDLLASGYTGGLSIEPHLSAIIHEAQEADSQERMYSEYLTYGRKLIAIVEQAKKILAK
jgi:sugar phosphate isomerase/epimerase